MSARLALALVAVPALAGCPPAPRPPAQSSMIHNEPALQPSTDVALAPGIDVLLATRGDIDGIPGDEVVELRSNGLLRAGGYTIPAPVDVFADAEFWRQDSILAVVTLRQGVNAVVLTTPTAEGDEDPPHRHRLYLVDGDELREVMDVNAPTPHAGLRFPGDGTARYDESGWAACDRAGYPPLPMSRDEIILAPGSGGRYEPRGRAATGQTFRCDELAACPYVYLVDASGARVVGEVLRHVRGADAYTLQSLALPSAPGPDTVVRIAEDKPEVTYLDEVFVEIGGERYWPRACTEAPAGTAPAYCAADHVFFVLREGDRLDLAFATGVDGPAAVFARGYYLPLAVPDVACTAPE